MPSIELFREMELRLEGAAGRLGREDINETQAGLERKDVVEALVVDHGQAAVMFADPGDDKDLVTEEHGGGFETLIPDTYLTYE
jgi:hypothetical protein